MRLSMALTSVSGHGESEEESPALHGTVWRRLVLGLTLVLMLGCVATLISPANKAGADSGTVFATGQVFASVGFAQVNVYDPSSGNQLNTLTDSSGTAYTAGSAFDANGNFYVTDDDAGDISEYAPDGTPLGQFATGLQNPLSIVFDNQGNMYVGQQTTPYIAEFSPTGQRLPDIGPLQTELYGDDWIDLAADQCTFYYTTEGTDILRYNKCTNTQEPDFNAAPFTGPAAFEVRILADGDVLVADSTAVLLLDQNGNLIQTYSCASLPGCQGQLFAVAVDPSGTSFWTGDSYSGNVWQVNLATGDVMQTINTNAAYLYGLSVAGELRVATNPNPVVNTTPTTLTIEPVTGNFSSPTPVTGVLTNTVTGAPVPNEPVTFTLNGSENCTATTNAAGSATCTITPSEPSNSYTLTGSFSGDTTTTTPLSSDSSSSTFTVNPDTSGLTYTGPTAAVNGQPITLTATLTTNTPSTGTALPGKVVTITIGTGTSAQSCSYTTDDNGNVSCTIASVDQPSGSEPISVSFGGDEYDTSTTAGGTLSVTEPTTLTVNPSGGSYNSSVTVSGTLTDANTTLPIANETVSFTVNGGTNGTQTCSGLTNSAGVASCSVTPTEPAGSYTVSGSFIGDSSQPVPLTGNTGSAAFTVTLANTSLTNTSPTSVTNGQPVTLTGTLTTNGSPLSGQPVTLTLGSGTTAQSCTVTPTTNSSGVVSCTISAVNQPTGPTPVTETYAGNTDYESTGATGSIQVGPSQVSTTLTVSPVTGTYGSPITVSATLVNAYTNNTPISGATVTFKVNGTQPCTGTTNTSGVATCTITPTEPAGSYTISASYGGNTTTVPTLLPSTGSSTFTQTTAPTTLTYTGSTSVTSGKTPTLSGTLTSNGTPLSGQTVTFTVGSGSSAQHCSATTNSAGQVSCTICMFNQNASPLPVTVSYGGNGDYGSTSTSVSVTVTTPTTLSVSAATGTYGQATTVTGTLTNGVTGQGISGQTITLTLGTQSCTATTGSTGKGSCSITPSESSGTYTLSGSFAGNTSTAPQLSASSGCNNFVVNAAPTTISYTGPTSVTSGSSTTLSAQLSSNGSGLGSQTVTITIGTGKSAQSCTGTTTSAGAASCTIAEVDQVSGSVAVTVSYSGNGYYASSSNSSSVSVKSSSGGGSSGGGSSSSGGQGGGSTGSKGSGGCQNM